jgi:glc operon protein GlcG
MLDLRNRRLVPPTLGLGLVLALLGASAATGQEEADTQAPTSAIRDRAGLFPGSVVEAYTARLRQFEREHGVPVVIETVESLGGKSINDAALEHARQTAGRGVYLLISKGDKAISRPFVTREFSEKFPEPKREAMQQAMIDAFRKGDFSAGLSAAYNGVAEAITGEVPPPVPLATSDSEPEAASDRADAPLVQRGRIDLTLEGARRIIQGAEAKARAMNLKVNIAVVDDGGHLLAFARMDGARPASGYTAITKATTAATFRQATGPLPPGAPEPDVWLNLSLQLTAAASGGKLTTLHGGVPVVLDDQIVGAVGVGGGTGEQDAEVGRAGIQSFLDALKDGAARGESPSP